MSVSRFLFSIAVVFCSSPLAVAQSGATSSRNTGREYGVNLTFAVYQYDAKRSPALEEVTRLSGTFSTPAEEIAYLKDKHKLEEVVARHVRSVGLRNNESFSDAVLLGPEYMVFSVTPREVVRGHMRLDLRVRYANEPVLDVKGVEFDSFETVMLRGGSGMFGVKYFVGGGGRQESAPVERTLLLSVTPGIVPLSSLRNRREELSHPVDEYGNAINTKDDDRFTPPVALERVAPKFESGRAVRGAVLLTATVSPEGKISNVRVLRSLDPIIDERAIEAFRQYKFSPALLNGKPVYATYREELTFAPPPPSTLELEEQQRKQREAEQDKAKKRRRWPWP
ncbi:MAG TPA: energy transducer TonB [Blastocatellia bacterium]|jgi:TonB family protein|nr:energy transducer TonB [Blastocatellia bacterium]